MSGAPAWAAELLEDDCVEKCTDEPGGCPDEGCADCSLICSSCPRAHVVVPAEQLRVVPAKLVALIRAGAGERVPSGPEPDGVFHPPRLAG